MTEKNIIYPRNGYLYTILVMEIWHILDYSSLNAEKEPDVIMAFYNGDKYETVEKLAEDLGDFILQLVQEQVGDQK